MFPPLKTTSLTHPRFVAATNCNSTSTQRTECILLIVIPQHLCPHREPKPTSNLASQKHHLTRPTSRRRALPLQTRTRPRPRTRVRPPHRSSSTRIPPPPPPHSTRRAPLHLPNSREKASPSFPVPHAVCSANARSACNPTRCGTRCGPSTPSCVSPPRPHHPRTSNRRRTPPRTQIMPSRKRRPRPRLRP